MEFSTPLSLDLKVRCTDLNVGLTVEVVENRASRLLVAIGVPVSQVGEGGGQGSASNGAPVVKIVDIA